MGNKRYKNHPHVTQEFVTAEFFKGKTVLRIEEEQGMKPNTIYKRLADWGIRSPHSIHYKKSENESFARKSAGTLQSKKPLKAMSKKSDKVFMIFGAVRMELNADMAKNPAFSSVDQGYTVIWEHLIKARVAIRNRKFFQAQTEMRQVAAMAIRFLHDIPVPISTKKTTEDPR